MLTHDAYCCVCPLLRSKSQFDMKGNSYYIFLVTKPLFCWNYVQEFYTSVLVYAAVLKTPLWPGRPRLPVFRTGRSTPKMQVALLSDLKSPYLSFCKPDMILLYNHSICSGNGRMHILEPSVFAFS